MQTCDLLGPLRAVAVALVLTACAGGSADQPPTTPTTPAPTPPRVARVDVSPSSLSVVERGSQLLSAVARDSLGNALPRTMSWSSANSAVATVTADGTVTGIAPGTTTVEAVADGVRGISSVVVRRMPVGAVVVSLLAGQVEVGKTTSAGAVVADSTGLVVTDRPVTWSSSAPATAAVSSAGVVSALAPGSAIITASVEGKSGSATVTVVPVPVATVSLSVSNVGIAVGSTASTVVTARDAAGQPLAGRVVTFTSSVPVVASVSATGQVSGVSAGTAVITATSEGRSASVPVQVVAPLQPWLLRDSVVVLEFPSIYTVHDAPNPTLYPNMRVQPAPFNMSMILPEIEKLVVPTQYDFVLLFSLREIPAWINSGVRYSNEATNLGFANGLSFTKPPGWTKLRAAPHMNNLDFWDSTAATGSTQSSLVLAHEIGHQWSAYLSAGRCNGLARLSDWRVGVHHTGCLATIGSHWTYLWARPEGAGILYSGATSARFNEFDLYAMGLMGYNEVRLITHQMHEDIRPYETAPRHPVTIDSLLAMMVAAGPPNCLGNCRRNPDTDPTVQSMRVLMVVVKGADEIITPSRRETAVALARTFPGVWNTATHGRSVISTTVTKKP